MNKDNYKIENDDKYSTLKTILSYVIIAIVGILIAVGIKAMGFNTVNISGESMSPTYHNHTLLMLKSNKEHEDNEIIVFSPPSSWGEDVSNKKYIKRIMALPGDEVKVTNLGVFVNNEEVKKLKSTYYKDYEGETNFTVPEGKVFVIGDNYQNSNDSLHQIVIGNPDYLVDLDKVDFSGDEVMKVKYWFN